MNHHGAAPSGPRTLTPLGLPDQLCDPGPVVLQRGLYVDCQTTGPEPEYDDVLELAMVPFTYTPEGRIVHVLHQHARVWHNDPGRALPREIAALTGLTDIMVRGQRIDVDAANALIGASNVVVAHNAAAHRPFFEKVAPAARTAAWACSFAEVPWTEAGFVEPRAALPRVPLRRGGARPAPDPRQLRGGAVAARERVAGRAGRVRRALRAGVGEHRRAVGGRCAGRGAGGAQGAPVPVDVRGSQRHPEVVVDGARARVRGGRDAVAARARLSRVRRPGAAARGVRAAHHHGTRALAPRPAARGRSRGRRALTAAHTARERLARCGGGRRDRARHARARPARQASGRCGSPTGRTARHPP